MNRERAVYYAKLAERCRAEGREYQGNYERHIFARAVIVAEDLAAYYWGKTA